MQAFRVVRLDYGSMKFPELPPPPQGGAFPYSVEHPGGVWAAASPEEALLLTVRWKSAWWGMLAWDYRVLEVEAHEGIDMLPMVYAQGEMMSILAQRLTYLRELHPAEIHEAQKRMRARYPWVADQAPKPEGSDLKALMFRNSPWLFAKSEVA